MKYKTCTVFLICFIFMISCATQPIIWEKSDSTNESFQKDNSECYMYAKQIGYMSNIGSNTNPFGGIYSSMGTGIAQGINQGITTKEEYKNCMILKGYTAQTKTKTKTETKAMSQMTKFNKKYKTMECKKYKCSDFVKSYGEFKKESTEIYINCNQYEANGYFVCIDDSNDKGIFETCVCIELE